jgi:hypothetical protein
MHSACLIYTRTFVFHWRRYAVLCYGWQWWLWIIVIGYGCVFMFSLINYCMFRCSVDKIRRDGQRALRLLSDNVDLIVLLRYASFLVLWFLNLHVFVKANAWPPTGRAVAKTLPWGGGGGEGWFYLNFSNSTFLHDFATPVRLAHGWRRANLFENLKSLDRWKWHLVFPTQYFNILVLPNNEDKYCYLQFNVTRKIEKILEISSLQIVRKGIWQLSPCHNTSHRL